MAKRIDGKKIAAEIKDELKEKVAAYKKEGVEITLAVIQVGNDPASTVYVGNKKKACEYVGIRSLSYEMEEILRQGRYYPGGTWCIDRICGPESYRADHSTEAAKRFPEVGIFAGTWFYRSDCGTQKHERNTDENSENA